MPITAGQSQDFSYTGGIQSIVLGPGTYRLEVWGAQGGSNTYYSQTGKNGGYAAGTYTITSGNVCLYVVVGGQGGDIAGGIDQYNRLNNNGGYNGGGSGTGSAGPGGGGATHIATSATVLSKNGGSTSSIPGLLLIGGGGGASNNSSGVGTYSYMNGQNGYTGWSGSYEYDNGGGGAGYRGGKSYSGDDPRYGDSGSCYVNSSLENPSTADNKRAGNGFARITCIKAELEVGQTFPFDYSGTIQSITLPPGKYRLECYGASGASSSGYSGGYGGKSVGELSIAQNTTLYIGIGGCGNGTTGGYNGGGDGASYTGGGGATHIATQNGLLRNLSSSNVLLVAGGGGGSGHTGTGGAGGGANRSGGNGTNVYNTYGKGGTLTDAGYGAGFGYGGYGYRHGGGGGGGYYGGGGGYSNACNHGGGGGSGYAKSTLTNVSGANGQHNGNGYVVITIISLGYTIITHNCTSNVSSATKGDTVTITIQRSRANGSYKQIFTHLQTDYSKAGLTKVTDTIYTFKIPDSVETDLVSTQAITITATFTTLKTINCSPDTSDYDAGDNIVAINIQKHMILDGHLQVYVGIVDDYDKIELERVSQTQYTFIVPDTIYQDLHGGTITIEAVYTKERVNSNFYKDACLYEPFELQVIGGDT